MNSSTEKPILSVVIPTRNESRNIKLCIESFRSAIDSGTCEVVVVDNNSDDGTQDIAASCGVRVVQQGPERSAQRNRGAREADADFLCFMDADMRMQQDTLREILAKIRGGEIDAMWIREIRVGRGWWIKTRNFERGFYDGTCIDSFRVFRKKTYFDVGGYDETLIGGEDWDIDHKILATNARTAITDGALLHDEGAFSWKRHLGKKQYYSKSFELYSRKWNNDETVRKQLGLGYRMLGVFVENGKWKRMLAHPLLMLSVWFERVAVGLAWKLAR